MCLSVIAKRVSIKSGTGYKVLKDLPNNCVRTWRDWSGIIPVVLKIGEWTADPNPEREYYELAPYHRGRQKVKSGFHIFLNKYEAFVWAQDMGWFPTKTGTPTIYQVDFKDVVQTGLDNGYCAVVARTIKVLHKVRR